MQNRWGMILSRWKRTKYSSYGSAGGSSGRYEDAGYGAGWQGGDGVVSGVRGRGWSSCWWAWLTFEMTTDATIGLSYTLLCL